MGLFHLGLERLGRRRLGQSARRPKVGRQNADVLNGVQHPHVEGRL